MGFPSVFKPDLFAGKVVLVTGGEAGIEACDIRRADAPPEAAARAAMAPFGGFHPVVLPRVLGQ